MRIVGRTASGWVERTADGYVALSEAPFRGGRRLSPVPSLAPLLTPVQPSKIVCVGRNYAAHAKELGNPMPSEPLLFLKPPSSLIASGAPIVLPPESERVEFEGEIGLVLGRQLRRPTLDEALSAIAGVLPANDVTARDLQKKDGQFTRGKGFDTFCPVGPWLALDVPLDDLTVQTRVNTVQRQLGCTRDMAFSFAGVLRAIADVMTLEAGDLVLTGTPEGVGPLTAGDVVEVEVAGITLRSPVVAEGLGRRV